jgi:hypothetical protein
MQLPTDHDYAVSTREYQTDPRRSKLPRLLPRLSVKPPQKQAHGFAAIDVVT